MDTLGNVLAYRYYVLNHGCRNGTGDLLVAANKDVITWGGDTAFFVLRADSNLAAVWAKRFTRHGGFEFIRELPGGDLLAGINMDTAGAVVARLDADGNFIWCKSYIRPRGMIHDALVESDSSFVITGFTDSTATTNPFIPLPPDFHPRLFMMKLDGNGEVQWCRGYDSAPYLWYTPQVSRLERSMDGNYAVLATLGYPENNFFYRPLLMKTDQNGDTLWTQSVGRTGFDHYAMDLLAYSDGGYVLSGYIWGDLPGASSSAAFLFKTDSLGNFPCWEQTHSVQVLDLFPSDSSFTLGSVDGVIDQSAFMVDTIFPFDTYDGCTFTMGMSSTMQRTRNALRVYPNPNTGQFTVEFADPLMAESYYSVYDALGKLLYQRPLPTGATLEEVDLSRYGRGTYAIKFTSPGGVCYERVVLE